MSIFRGNPSAFVTKQINVRQNKMLERNTPEVISWINSKTANVRLTSSVNIEDEQLAKYLGFPVGNTFAKSLVLENGELFYDREKNTFKQRSGLGLGGSYGDSTNGSHTYQGNVPMSGITGVTINSLSANGTLSTASITIRCNSKSELERVSLLYATVGYSILLEISNTIYFDNNGKYQTDYRKYNILDENNLSKEQIFKDIYSTSDNPRTASNKTKLIENSSGNYYASFLLVKNFSWKNVQGSDASFDLTIDAVSINEVQESLRINYIGQPNLAQFKNLDKSQHENVLKDFTKSKLHGLLSSLQATVQNNFDKVYEGKNILQYNIYDIPTFGQSFFLSGYVGLSGIKDDVFQSYIKFDDFISILNNKILPTTDKKTPYIKVSLKDDRDEDLTILAHYLQIPTQLDVCHIESVKNVDLLRFRLNLTDSSPLVDDLSYFVDDKYNRGYLKNIFINIQYLITSLNSVVKENSVNLFDYINFILKGISESLGGINDLRLVSDMESDISRIIDINYTETKKDRVKELTLELSGLKTIVTSYGMESAIFPAMMSIISISAGAGGKSATTGINTNCFDILHQGISDRILKQVYNPEEDNNADGKEKLIQKCKDSAWVLEKSIADYVLKLNNNDGYSSIVYGNISQSLHEFINLELSLQQNVNDNTLHSAVAILPLKLDIELDGISGFKIGDIFKIPQISLPVQYYGYSSKTSTKIGFAITRINHSVNNNVWRTNFVTQTIILDSGKNYIPITKTAIYDYSPLLLSMNKKFDINDYLINLK